MTGGFCGVGEIRRQAALVRDLRRRSGKERRLCFRAVHQVGRLTPRELEVFLLLGSGMSNHAISTLLSVTERTVKAHVTQVLEKLVLESRLQAGLVSYAYQETILRSTRALAMGQ